MCSSTTQAMLCTTIRRACATIVLAVLLAGCAAKEPEALPTEHERQGLSGVYPPEAESAFAKARVLWRPSTASVMAAERCSDPQQAVELLSAAIAIAPDFSEAYARRGLAASEMGLREQAFDDLTTAIRLDSSPANYAYRGLVSIRAEQSRAAMRDLEYSLELQPSQHRAHTFFGVLYLTEDNAPEACRSFGKACSNGDCSFLEIARQEGLCS